MHPNREPATAVSLIFGNWTACRLFRLAFAALLWLFVTQTPADPDLWGHVRFGLDSLATRALPLSDSYSFTSDRLWVNHEWLAEALMALAYVGGGVVGLNVLKLSLIVILAWTAGAILRHEPATSGVPAAVGIGLTILVTTTRMLAIRPQLFGVALFAVVLYSVRLFDRGHNRAVWAIPPCFLLWVNLHGSWVVGLAAVGVWLIGSREHWHSHRRGVLLAAGTMTVAATFFNPYGIGLWQFLLETVRFERVEISEWGPLLTLPVLILSIEAIVPAIAVVGVIDRRQGIPFKYLAVVCILWIATFKTSRVDAFAQVATVMLMSTHFVRGIDALGRPFRSSLWHKTLPLGFMPAAVAVAVLIVGSAQLRQIVVSGAWVPDQQAASFLGESAPGARVLTWFDWGEYAIWQLAPVGIRVSMDGRRETVYSSEELRRHWSFYRGELEGLDHPDRIGADYIWVPLNIPVTGMLPSRGWHCIFRSSKSAVFSRNGSGHDVTLAPPAPESFQWP